jgi:hypothetical protein
MRTLFGASRRYAIIYSSDCNDNSRYEGPHIFHRNVTSYVASNFAGWQPVKRIANRYPYAGDNTAGSFSDFLIYAKR